jgi:pimeloyl-ACP methyl ester carboxylesterase
LDSEEVRVQAEDDHVIVLWHIFDPRKYTPMTAKERDIRGPECIDDIRPPSRKLPDPGKRKPKYPIILLHGLLQSSGVYVTNDEHSLGFWLCKQGYDVVYFNFTFCSVPSRRIEILRRTSHLSDEF